MASAQELLAKIDQISAENKEVISVADEIKKQQARAQTKIAWVIIWAFVGAVALLFAQVLCSLALNKDAGWKEPAEFLSGIISSILLPVVTLVLGYYFGKEKTE